MIKKQSVSSKIKTLLPYILITVFVLVFAISNATFAKYVGQTNDSSQAVAGDFYFTSVLLQEPNEDGTAKKVELYDSNGYFIVNLYNTFEGKESQMDIEFNVVLEGNATMEIWASESSGYEETTTEQSETTTEQSETTDVKKITGKMLAGESHIVIKVTPHTYDPTEEITITATSTAPYEKVLSACFSPLNPYSFSPNEIGAVTVLHENYTELLVITGSKFVGDVYVIIGDHETTMASYFPSKIETANKVKFYYPTTTGGIPVGEDGIPEVYNYVESLKTGGMDYTGAIFYLDLNDVFVIEGESYLKANRTYVMEFLGETKVNNTATPEGGIVYSDNTDGVKSAVIFLTSDQWINTES